MKTKLEMAHEWYMMQTRRNGCALVADAWKYADAMQAAADKRGEEEMDKRSDELRNILKLSKFKPLELQPDSKEWQPDWSQAPDWANWWVATANQSGKITGGWFYENEPEFGLSGGPSTYHSVGCRVVLTDSFGYTGNWRNSLRKRPE